jgi:hypothetical protein
MSTGVFDYLELFECAARKVLLFEEELGGENLSPSQADVDAFSSRND